MGAWLAPVSRVLTHASAFLRRLDCEAGITHSPSQNGVAEHCNQTLASMACGMLIDADLPNWFWPFAIQTAVHIKNHVPHSILPLHITPFQLWYNHKPNLSYLRLFGSHCTSRILPTPSSKFQAHGEPACFLGYVRDAKGYCIWVPGPNGCGGSLKIRCDILFHSFPTPLEKEGQSSLWDDVPLLEKSTMYESHVSNIKYKLIEILLSVVVHPV